MIHIYLSKSNLSYFLNVIDCLVKNQNGHDMFQLQIKHPYDPTLHMIYNYPNNLYKTVLAPTFHVDDEYITSCNNNVTIIPKYDLIKQDNNINYIKTRPTGHGVLI